MAWRIAGKGVSRRLAAPARGHQITAPALGESTSPQYMEPSVAR
jgi:hypothetical protein